MEYRTLGKAGPQVSVIAQGTWAIGGPWAHGWGPVDDQASIRTIRCALDAGINLIDTANVYGLGHAEEIIARAVKGQREKAVIATKVGAVVDEVGGITWDSTPAALFKEVENSLRRLDTDYIDIYQIHWPDASTPLADTMGAFNRLIEQGKIRYAAVCNFSKAQLEESIRVCPLVSNQIRYNLLERDNEADVIPFCIQNGIGLMAYGPLAHGLLAGEFKRGDQLRGDDWRSRYTLFEPAMFEKILGVVDHLRSIGEGYERTLAHLALNWILSRPGITTALVGMLQPWQLEENIRATGWTLTPEDLKKIDQLIDSADLGLRILPPDEYLEKTKEKPA
jgi:aryl-alcohol dehydrogenase-like predicted oxidoreductase